MNKQQLLDNLRKKMLMDEELPLRKGATNLVFGGGSPDTEILFVGEGPGYWEDIKGKPFVGNSGMLLNKLLQLIEVKREDIFITNVICYRSPNNRDPLPEEIRAFKPYLDRMIEIINPKMVVTLGRFSMAKFLPGVKISSVHGKVYNIEWNGRGLIVIPMYHPAAVLRNRNLFLLAKEDFQKIPKVLEEAKSKIVVKQMNLV